MRKISLIILSCLFAMTSMAQEEMSIQAAIDACVAMRDAVAADDKDGIKQSADRLRECGAHQFGSLRCKDDSVSSLNGHLLFDEVFADSLAEGKDVYQQADDISRSGALRGQTADGSLFTKTCFVKAGGSTKYTFLSKGHQELAVVAEAGGLVTMNIHVTNSAGLDERHNDTKDWKKGRPQRKTSFDLPDNIRNNVELEVFNRSKKDITFVVISN